MEWAIALGAAHALPRAGRAQEPQLRCRYVFGRYQYQRQISSEGRVHQHMRAVEMPQWRVHLPEHHEGLSAGGVLKNQQRLASNRNERAAALLNGPAREGLALLQGLAALWSLRPRGD